MDARGDEIKRLRLARNGMSRSRLADELGCSYNHIYGLETGSNVGSEEFFNQLAQYFDVPVERVMVVAADAPKPEPAPAPKPKRTAYPTRGPEPARPVPPPRRTKKLAAEQAAS